MSKILSSPLRITVGSLLLAGSLAFLSLVPTSGATLLKENDHLAFIGDAVTSDLGYTVCLEDYLIACQQVPGLNMQQFGWCGATSPDEFVGHVTPDLMPFKPTVATIFFPSDGKDPEGRRTAETNLVDALKKAGVQRIVLGSPLCKDFHQDAAGGEAYNQKLQAIADIDKDVATKEGVVYADVFGATLAAMKSSKAKFGPDYIFNNTGGHPEKYHTSLVIAYAFLKALGCDGDLGTITADFATQKADATGGHTVATFADQTLMVQSKTYSFCFPGYPFLNIGNDPFIDSFPFNQDLNRLTLVVKNLPTPGAKIIWNDGSWTGEHMHDYTADELAKGVNLAADIESPFTKRFPDISFSVVEQLEKQQMAGIAHMAGKPDPAAEAGAEAALANAKAYVTAIPYKITIQTLVPFDPNPPGPVPVIVDTDMNGDVDDVGALTLINSFAVQGEVNLLACVTNTRDRDLSSGAVCKAINTYYGHPDVPIGVYHGADAHIQGSSYTLGVHQKFAPDFPTDDKLPAGVDVYRKALAGAPDNSVVVVSLGLLQNIKDLEDSKPDAVSPLSGEELIKKKVRKLAIMANTQKTDQPILDAWPTPILWTTYVGTNIGTGRGFQNTPETNPSRYAYSLFGSTAAKSALTNGRGSWDPVTAWVAIRGPGEMFDLIGGGSYRIDSMGHPSWINNGSKKETLVTFKMPLRDVSKIIDQEYARPPVAKSATP
jgi:hypothetical protein